MNSSNCVLTNTNEWFLVAKPNPTALDLQNQIGVHCEEITEMLDEMQGTNSETVMLLINAFAAMKELGEHLKNSKSQKIHLKDPVRLLDSLCDQIVTNVGVGNYAAFNMVGALNEVNRSNFSKFEDGKAVLKPNGKIAKGKDYSEPNLSPFI